MKVFSLYIEFLLNIDPSLFQAKYEELKKRDKKDKELSGKKVRIKSLCLLSTLRVLLSKYRFTLVVYLRKANLAKFNKMVKKNQTRLYM